MKKKKGSKKSHTYDNSNINVTPVMNLFVVLIPFLLFSAVFVKLSVINVALPGLMNDPVPRVGEEKDKGPNVQITVGVSKDHLLVGVSGDENFTQEIALKGLKDPLQQLHSLLVKLKQAFPSKKDIIVIPDAHIKYEMIVNVLDAARDLFPTDPEIEYEGKKLQRLFPNVVMGSTM